MLRLQTAYFRTKNLVVVSVQPARLYFLRVEDKAHLTSYLARPEPLPQQHSLAFPVRLFLAQTGRVRLTASNEPKHYAKNSALDPDTLLQNRYRIVRQLGKGGMGAVYEATDERLGISVALKETLSSEPSIRKQFEQEARLLASMQHPALPRVSDFFAEGDRLFLVMQFVGGIDLAKIIAQQPGPLPREQVIAWADQLLDALIYLHSRDRQVIHRDIKPHNLKLTATGQIALLDFGLAKAQPVDPSATVSAAFFGYTRQYAPLEQIQDKATDPRSDIYALGATLYHLLTGTKPPDALVRAASLVNAEPDPLKPANRIHRTVGIELAAILNKAMAQKPEDRYSSASEFREALRCVGRKKITTGPLPEFLRRDEDDAEGSVKLAMVESSKRFGPGAMTFVLVAALSLMLGAIYGSQHWTVAVQKVAGRIEGKTDASVEKSRRTERTRPIRSEEKSVTP
jgi:serine/threonine protein kinase